MSTKRDRFHRSDWTHAGIALVGAALCCALADAATPVQAWRNLKQQRSFRFTLTLSRTEPPMVSGSFSGQVILPDTEERTGFWAGETGPVPVRLKARGAFEYAATTGDSQAQGEWQVLARGDEASLLVQVEQVMARDSFLAVDKAGKPGLFAFVPNLPFLNPLGDRKLKGRFELDKNSSLPEAITVRSDDSVVFWQVRFTDYNQTQPIEFPFAASWRVTLIQEGPRDSLRLGALEDTATFKQRLAAGGYRATFDWHTDTLVVELERTIRASSLSLLARQARFRLGVGRFLEKPQLKGKSLGPVTGERLPMAGDTTVTVVAERVVLEREELGRVTVADSPLAPGQAVFRLPLAGKAKAKLARLSKLERSGLYWILIMDSSVVALARIEKHGTRPPLTLAGPCEPQTIPWFQSLLDSRPLSASFRVVTSTAIEPEREPQ